MLRNIENSVLQSVNNIVFDNELDNETTYVD